MTWTAAEIWSRFRVRVGWAGAEEREPPVLGPTQADLDWRTWCSAMQQAKEMRERLRSKPSFRRALLATGAVWKCRLPDTRSTIGCQFGFGATLQEALSNAKREALKNTWPHDRIEASYRHAKRDSKTPTP